MTFTEDEYRQYKPLLIWTSWRTFRGAGNTWEDDAHDAFVALLESSGVGNVRAWLWSAVRLSAITKARRKWREVALPDNLPSTDDLERDLISAEVRGMVDRLVSHLTPIQREVVTRFYMDAQSKEQILAEMALDLRQYVNAKNKGLARLRQLAKRRKCALAS